jgi:hypothetical protein
MHLVQMPLPVPEPTNPADPLASNVSGKNGAKPVPPEPHSFVAKIDPALKQQVFDLPQTEWEAHVQQDHQPDHLG